MSATEKSGPYIFSQLGKTRLRPGGVEATEWLFRQSQLTPGSQVLEVACNMATTAIELVQRFGCTVYAIDMDKNALNKARSNVAHNGLENHIHVMAANANTLPFADNSFDVVINEAMLTMYADKAKAKLIAEYHRVLKPGGRLLTHDIMFTAQKLEEGEQYQLVQVVKSNVSPLTKQGWSDLLMSAGFEQVMQQNGKMSLMSPRGLIRDEGVKGAIKIAFNGMRTYENRRRFLKMFRFFHSQRHQLNYIACCSIKGK